MADKSEERKHSPHMNSQQMGIDLVQQQQMYQQNLQQQQ